MRSILLGLVVLVATVTVASADSKQNRYIGIHPIAKSLRDGRSTEGGGLCYIEGPHVHVFGADKIQYRDHRGHHHFVGDPVAYGYDGPRHTYKGHHPIHVHAVVGSPDPDVHYCYLDGPHFHSFKPPEGPEFKIVGDAYFYVAEPPKVYVDARPAFIGINAVYRPLLYARPVVVVEAPVGWIGARVDLGGPAVIVDRPAAIVTTPGVRVQADVRIPLPSIRVDIGLGSPGVIVRDRPVIIRERVKYKKYKKHKHRGRR